jgi:hypothetical protein
MLHKERMRASQKINDAAAPENRSKLAGKIRDDAKSAEDRFRDSLNVYVRSGKGDSLPAAALRSELAWLLNNYLAARTSPEIRARIDEAEKLYSESLAIQEKLAGGESDTTLRTVLACGDFYMRWVNFEKALPFYERYIAAVEKKQGANSKALVPALRGAVELLVITVREKEAGEIAKRISGITGKPENLPVTFPRLALRGRNIVRVKNPRFAPPESFNDPGLLFSSAYGAGVFAPMGGFKVRPIAVSILVDENGNVVEAKAVEPGLKNVEDVEKAAMNSKFRPFVYNGDAHKMRGAIIYPYFEQ